MFTTEMEVESFLKEYKRSRVIIEASIKATLNRALEFEEKFKKPFYDFKTNEVLEMYKSVGAISVRSLQNANLTLKHAARYILNEKGRSLDNIYDNITKDLIDQCVDKNKKSELILTKEDLTNIQNELVNWTDKGILQMLFLGAGSNWLKELTFFNVNQINRKDGAMYFKTGKVIHITNEDYELISRACAEEELMTFGETSRISKVKSLGIYKQRFNALSDNADTNSEEDAERRYRWVQRRLALIGEYVGVDLKSGAIQDSGLLHCLQQGVKETNLDFKGYIKTKECAEISKRFDLYTDLYKQILVEKFQKYF